MPHPVVVKRKGSGTSEQKGNGGNVMISCRKQWG